MSRKHFRAIAEALRVSEASFMTVREVAGVLAKFNPNFDRERFIDAAYRSRRGKVAA